MTCHTCVFEAHDPLVSFLARSGTEQREGVDTVGKVAVADKAGNWDAEQIVCTSHAAEIQPAIDPNATIMEVGLLSCVHV